METPDVRSLEQAYAFTAVNADWRMPKLRGSVIHFTRKDSEDERVLWAGYVDAAVRGTETTQVTMRQPQGLLDGMPLPFLPPGSGETDVLAGLNYWWRQLLYVFTGLKDPRRFPPLPGELSERDQRVLSRYVSQTRELARCSVINATAGLHVEQDAADSEVIVTPTFPPMDHQAGFAALLRQCLSDEELASFSRVYDVMWQATDGGRRTADQHHALREWRHVVMALRKKSIDQLFREALAQREGYRAFAYTELWSPEVLLKRYNYGGLLHWGREREKVVRTEDDELAAARERMDFLKAAVGLAHALIGFGELVRAATASVDSARSV